MASLHLLAALLAAHLQLNIGQQIGEGNNLIAVASHKLAAIKQQSQKPNVTDTDPAAEIEENLEVKTEQELEPVHFNTSALYPGGGTITSIKFVPYSAYDGPPPSFSIMNIKNIKNIPDPSSGTYTTSLANSKNVSSNDEQPITEKGADEQTEDKVAYIGKSPIFISFTPQFSGTTSSQSPYIMSALPIQSSLSNVATLQPSPPPPLNRQSPQTFSSVQCQSSNIQNPANMRLRFVPATSTVPTQNSVPIQSTLSARSAVPVHNSMPIQNTVPIQSTVPIQNTISMQNTVPIPKTIPIQSSVPISNTVPIQSSVPIQRTAMPSSISIQNASQRPTPIQNSIDNVLPNSHLSLLLSHLLSQSPIKKDYTVPSNIRYLNQDQPPKQTAVKTLLPLLLQLLTEKNNDCCEYRNNKKERTRAYSKYKQGNKKYENFDADFGMLSDAAHYFQRPNQNRRLNKPYDESLEEDYSDESSDYSVEDYDDED